MRRSRIDVICSILSALENGAMKPTPLMCKSNLSHKLFVQYVADLEAAKLIRKTAVKGIAMYALTDQGREYVEEYNRFIRFSSSFGL